MASANTTNEKSMLLIDGDYFTSVENENGAQYKFDYSSKNVDNLRVYIQNKTGLLFSQRHFCHLDSAQKN